MATKTLRIIPRPAANTRTVVMKAAAPVITGRGGSTAYRCGGCRLTLVKGIQKARVINVVIRCPGCGSFNDVP